MQTEGYRSTWATYQAAWEDIGSSERQDLLYRSVSDHCIYSDPMVECHGREELIAYIEEFRKSMPGGSFKNHEFINHHSQSHAEWKLYDATGKEVQPGSSWAEFGQDGRITRVTGFFAVPEAA